MERKEERNWPRRQGKAMALGAVSRKEWERGSSEGEIHSRGLRVLACRNGMGAVAEKCAVGIGIRGKYE